MLLAKQLFCTSDIRQNTSQYWFLHALMTISTQFFPYFCVFLLSPAASQPGVFSLMAVVIDELMIPEPAAVTPLLLGSLSGVIVRCRVAALLLEPWFPWEGTTWGLVWHLTGFCGPAGWEITFPVSALAASCQSASPGVWSWVIFPHPFVWCSPR